MPRVAMQITSAMLSISAQLKELAVELADGGQKTALESWLGAAKGF
jgi:hypothetical protein